MKGDSRKNEQSSRRNIGTSSITSELTSEISSEYELEYQRQNALNLAYSVEHEECEEESEAEKLESGMNIFRVLSHEHNAIVEDS